MYVLYNHTWYVLMFCSKTHKQSTLFCTDFYSPINFQLYYVASTRTKDDKQSGDFTLIFYLQSKPWWCVLLVRRF